MQQAEQAEKEQQVGMFRQDLPRGVAVEKRERHSGQQNQVEDRHRPDNGIVQQGAHGPAPLGWVRDCPDQCHARQNARERNRGGNGHAQGEGVPRPSIEFLGRIAGLGLDADEGRGRPIKGAIQDGVNVIQRQALYRTALERPCTKVAVHSQRIQSGKCRLPWGCGKMRLMLSASPMRYRYPVRPELHAITRNRLLTAQVLGYAMAAEKAFISGVSPPAGGRPEFPGTVRAGPARYSELA